MRKLFLYKFLGPGPPTEAAVSFYLLRFKFLDIAELVR